MKIDFLTPPPPLKFGEGENEFSLKLARTDSTDRMAILDAIQEGSLMRVQAELERHVTDWANVCNAEGVAIPFEEEDDKGGKTRNLRKFLGALSLSDQLRVMARLLAFVGLPSEQADTIAARLAAAGDKGVLAGDARPTTTQAASTKTPASGK